MHWHKSNNVLASLRSSARWQNLRSTVLTQQSGLCKLCGGLASEVHHIELATPDNFFRRENLVGLCCECHQKVHTAYRAGITWELLNGRG